MSGLQQTISARETTTALQCEFIIFSKRPKLFLGGSVTILAEIITVSADFCHVQYSITIVPAIPLQIPNKAEPIHLQSRRS